MMGQPPTNPRKKMEWLYERGRQAGYEVDFVRAERYLAQAATLANHHADLPARIRIHHWWANAHWVLGNIDQAIQTCIWLMSLANRADMPELLKGDQESLEYLAMAFTVFVDNGHSLPEMPNRELHEVLDLGHRFLERTGQKRWAHTLHFERGHLLRHEARLEEARLELEIAVELRRQDPYTLGMWLGTHLCELGEALLELKEYDAAARCFREVWQGDREIYGHFGHRWALGGLARSAAFLGQLDIAEQRARESLALANQLGTPGVQLRALETLLDILIRKNQVEELSHLGALAWNKVRQTTFTADWYSLGFSLTKIRLAQARHLIGIPANPTELIPESVTAISAECRSLAQQRLTQAARWIERTRTPAQLLDEQTGTEHHRREIETLITRIAEVRALLEGR